MYRLISSGTIEEMMYLRQVYKQVSLLRKLNATVISDFARSNLFRQRAEKICNHSQARENATVQARENIAVASAGILETSVSYRKKRLENLAFSLKHFRYIFKLLIL